MGSVALVSSCRAGFSSIFVAILVTFVRLFRFTHVRAAVSWKFGHVGNLEGYHFALFLFFFKCIRLLSICAGNQALKNCSRGFFALQTPQCRSSECAICGLLTCAVQNHEMCAPSSGTRVARALSSTCSTVVFWTSLSLFRSGPSSAQICCISRLFLLPSRKKNSFVARSSRRRLQPRSLVSSFLE